MSTPTIASLTALIDQLQKQVRDLASGNALNRGSVQDASGAWVPISALAFGQVAGQALGTLNLATNTAAWVSSDPYLDVYVQGGRLRLDYGALLVVGGLNLRMAMGYSLTGPSPSGLPDGSGPLRQGPSDSRALMIKSTGNAISSDVAAGMPDLVSGLPPGWYRVQSQYQLFGEVQATAGETFGNAINRRLFATPL